MTINGCDINENKKELICLHNQERSFFLFIFSLSEKKIKLEVQIESSNSKKSVLLILNFRTGWLKWFNFDLWSKERNYSHLQRLLLENWNDHQRESKPSFHLTNFKNPKTLQNNSQNNLRIATSLQNTGVYSLLKLDKPLLKNFLQSNYKKLNYEEIISMKEMPLDFKKQIFEIVLEYDFEFLSLYHEKIVREFLWINNFSLNSI